MGGDFVLPHDAGKPVLLIAAGIGITPFLSQLSADDAARDTVVVYLAKGREELACVEQLEASGAKVVARLADGSTPPRSTWSTPVPPESMQRALKSWFRTLGDREVFVSGSPPASVESLRAAARGAGARRVHVDSFAGY